MHRVHTIRSFRPLVSTAALAVVVGSVALWGIGREVWVAHVFQNSPANLVDVPRFFLAAFTHTRLIVQTLSLTALASVVFLAREFVRVLTPSLPARA